MGAEHAVTWVSRFAPSPTGRLHLGHLVNAIYVWGITRALGGEVILRIEDHDRGRCRPEYEAGILEDLEWLGFEPDRESGSALRQGATNYRQSDNHHRYASVLAQLAVRGLLYTCSCSRSEVLARTGEQAGELRYDGHCRGRGYSPGEAAAVRLRLGEGPVEVEDLRRGRIRHTPAQQCGDLLLLDRHGSWTYQFAVTVDDFQHGVNLVIRGEDLVESTGRQVMLARLLGRAEAPRFLHHPLIADAEGRKLSKRDFARGLCDYRNEGRSPESVLGEAAWRVGLLPANAPLAVQEIPALFQHDPIIRLLRG